MESVIQSKSVIFNYSYPELLTGMLPVLTT